MDLFKMADMFVEKIKTDYKGDVAIAAYYGSYAQGTANAKSDLDIFFIPATDRGWELSDCFIIDGIGIDLFGVSWERAKGIADFNETIVSILADCRILYYRSEEDLARFRGLQENIKALCEPGNKAVMVSKAIEKFNHCFVNLFNLERREDLPSVRVEAFNILTTVFESLALLNQTYLTKGWGKNTGQILSLAIKPDRLEQYADSIVTGECKDKILESCTALIEATREVMLQEQRASAHKVAFADMFTNCYEEMKSMFNKIITACDNNDYETAFYAAAAMQNELATFLAKVGEGSDYSRMNTFYELRGIYDGYGLTDILSVYQSGNLQPFKQAVMELESEFVEVLQRNHLKIKEFATLQEYEHYLGSVGTRPEP